MSLSGARRLVLPVTGGPVVDMCDGMFGGHRHVTGLRDHWILGHNSFDFVSCLLGQQCRAKGYLLCPDSLYHKTGSGVHQLVAFQIY